MSTTLTIRLDDHTKERLEHLAKATARSKSYLVTNAIKEFIALNEWQIQEIRTTLREADQPEAKFIDHEEVTDWLKTWGTGKEKNPPQCG
jgi:RHH-type transcriptional regulator, rel operon repressor / antitoxin RelB